MTSVQAAARKPPPGTPPGRAQQRSRSRGRRSGPASMCRHPQDETTSQRGASPRSSDTLNVALCCQTVRRFIRRNFRCLGRRCTHKRVQPRFVPKGLVSFTSFAPRRQLYQLKVHKASPTSRRSPLHGAERPDRPPFRGYDLPRRIAALEATAIGTLPCAARPRSDRRPRRAERDPWRATSRHR
jgi:hypothetical protein